MKPWWQEKKCVYRMEAMVLIALTTSRQWTTISLECSGARQEGRKNNVFIEAEGSYYLMGREKRLLDVKPLFCPCEE